jgi:hypothetical protein
MSKSERTCKYAALIFISSLFYYSGVWVSKFSLNSSISGT